MLPISPAGGGGTQSCTQEKTQNKVYGKKEKACPTADRVKSKKIVRSTPCFLVLKRCVSFFSETVSWNGPEDDGEDGADDSDEHSDPNRTSDK